MLEKTNKGTKVSGFYRGKVLEHGVNGRCKIFWYGVNPMQYENSPDDLPYSEQAAPLFASSSNGNGVYSYPAVGTIVWGFFANEDVNYPVYFAATLDNSVNSNNYSLKKYELDKEQKVKKILIGDLTIEIDSDRNSVSIANGDSSIRLLHDGTITLGGKNIIINGNEISIESLSDLMINARNIDSIAQEKTKIYARNVEIRTRNGGTSIKGDLPYYGIQVW